MPHRTEAGGKERPYPGKRNREQKPSIDRCFPGKKPLIEKVTQDTKNPISKLSKTKAILPCNINYAKAAHEIKGHNTKKNQHTTFYHKIHQRTYSFQNIILKNVIKNLMSNYSSVIFKKLAHI